MVLHLGFPLISKFHFNSSELSVAFFSGLFQNSGIPCEIEQKVQNVVRFKV